MIWNEITRNQTDFWMFWNMFRFIPFEKREKAKKYNNIRNFTWKCWSINYLSLCRLFLDDQIFEQNKNKNTSSLSAHSRIGTSSIEWQFSCKCEWRRSRWTHFDFDNQIFQLLMNNYQNWFLIKYISADIIDNGHYQSKVSI